jgi:hypothetical protein
VWLSSLLYKRATTMPAAPRMAGMAVAMAPLSEAFELALLAALLALLEALLADLEALLEALLMLLETLLETELAEEEADEEADEAADEPEPVKLLMREPGRGVSLGVSMCGIDDHESYQGRRWRWRGWSRRW